MILGAQFLKNDWVFVDFYKRLIEWPRNDKRVFNNNFDTNGKRHNENMEYHVDNSKVRSEKTYKVRWNYAIEFMIRERTSGRINEMLYL